jgi:hypothetical protein
MLLTLSTCVDLLDGVVTSSVGCRETVICAVGTAALVLLLIAEIIRQFCTLVLYFLPWYFMIVT